MPGRCARTTDKSAGVEGDLMSSAEKLACTRPYVRDYTYNLFRKKQQPSLLCAVPEHCPVPGFLNVDQWTFERPLQPSEPLPSGFHDRAALLGVRFNGFYLFQLTRTIKHLAA
jgi:hypothetical protein